MEWEGSKEEVVLVVRGRKAEKWTGLLVGIELLTIEVAVFKGRILLVLVISGHWNMLSG